MFGRVRMYETGFAVFVLGSLACALAWNEPSIIAFRILQGVGGAFIMANSGAVIADLYPRELRGKAYGYTSVGWTMGAIIGIVLGGVIVTYISWRWIFWINVPVGVAALAVATRVLHDKAERSRRRLDLPGMISLGLGLFGVLWAMTRLANTAFDATVTGFLIGGLVLLGVFVLIERRVAEPMLPLSIFRVPTMSASLLASLFQGLASFAVLFLLIMYLQGPRGLSPIHASLLLVPGYVLGSVVGPYAGRLADRRGPVLPATAGLAIQVVSPGHLRAAHGDHRAVGGGAGEHHQRHRGELLLPGQQLGGDEGGATGGVRHRVGHAADVREHRDGVLVRGGHLDRLPVDLPRPGLRDLRRQHLAARRGGRRVHLGPARRVLRLDGVHGARRRPVRAAGGLLPETRV